MPRSRESLATFRADVSATEALGDNKAHLMRHGAHIDGVCNVAHLRDLCEFCGSTALSSAYSAGYLR